jgi:hypothetical protein
MIKMWFGKEVSSLKKATVKKKTKTKTSSKKPVVKTKRSVSKTSGKSRQSFWSTRQIIIAGGIITGIIALVAIYSK